jgi:hypothetical protein
MVGIEIRAEISVIWKILLPTQQNRSLPQGIKLRQYTKGPRKIPLRQHRQEELWLEFNVRDFTKKRVNRVKIEKCTK